MKAPKSRRSKSACTSTSFKPLRRPPGAFVKGGSGGTTQATTAMQTITKTPVSTKRPLSPICCAKIGAKTKDRANISPMLAPTSAMALVRTASRVMSASKAVTAAEIAPAPCKERPTINQPSVEAAAATKLPKAKITKPIKITFLRPKRSEAMPNGICKIPWVSP